MTRETLHEDNLPRHVAIIMDGNRRWAREHNLPILMGHKKAAQERVEELIEHAGELGVEYLTFWAFSTENWGRAKNEVKGLMSIFRWSLDKKSQQIVERGAKIRYIGDLSKFPEDIQADFDRLMQVSATNNKITVTFALNYGGRDEVVRAMKRMAEQVKHGDLKPEEIDAELVDGYLDSAGLPDLDLIIRTSGEQRLSGFMPWQSCYAELYFSPVKMPDFDASEFDKAMEEFGKRKRRFGKG